MNDALIIVDMQKWFLEDLKREEKRSLVNAVISILNASKIYNVPVATLEYYSKGPTIPEIRANIRTDYCLFRKTMPNGFYKTRLKNQLTEWNTEHVYIIGGFGARCLTSTAKNIPNGINVSTAADLVFDIPGEEKETIDWFVKNGKYYHHHESIIEDMAKNYIKRQLQIKSKHRLKPQYTLN